MSELSDIQFDILPAAAAVLNSIIAECLLLNMQRYFLGDFTLLEFGF